VAIGGGEAGQYARKRAWGSISFGVTATVIGGWLASRDPGRPDRLVPLLVVAFLGLTFLATLGLQGEARARPRRGSRIQDLLRSPPFLLLLAVAFLHSLSSAPYRGFLPILLENRGMSLATLGQVSMVAVAAEATAFHFFENLHRRLRLWHLLAIAFAASAVRSILTAWTRSELAIGALQTLHAFTFGVYWAAALRWLASCVPPPQVATARMLFTAVTLGLGTVLGTLGAGYVFDLQGSAEDCFVAGAMVQLVPLLIVLVRGRRLDPGGGAGTIPFRPPATPPP
jgi:MFS transporter, PPP family, 3-phenylpropionic acid transporter